MNYTHIVFDVDGTLLNTEECILVSLQAALQETDGIDVAYEDLTFAMSCTSLVVLDRLRVKDPEATLKTWIQKEGEYIDRIHLFEGIEGLLRCLITAGYELGIVTSRTWEEFNMIFGHRPICELFSTIICSDDTEEHKPSPAPLLKYMEKTGTKAEALLYVGDSPGDARCAADAGVDFALATWGTQREDIPAAYYPKSPQQLFWTIDTGQKGGAGIGDQ